MMGYITHDSGMKRDLIKKGILLGVAICLGIVMSVMGSGFLQREHVIDWGIGPSKDERTPTPPPYSQTMLDAHNGIWIGDTSRREVYLTFDLGYEAGYTAEVLDILKENKIKAIFFLCGNYLQEKELIDRMIAEGHTIGNHTDRHKDLPKLSDELIKKDIEDFSTKFKEKGYTQELKHFRPPCGRISERVLKEVNSQGMKTVMWSSAIVDWGKSPIDAQACADKITRRIHPGALVLLHITNSGTPKMLRLLIPQIIEKGYTFGDAGAL
jgi:peptidoglycan-N-acetylmuramic acid deacetylase